MKPIISSVKFSFGLLLAVVGNDCMQPAAAQDEQPFTYVIDITDQQLQELVSGMNLQATIPPDVKFTHILIRYKPNESSSGDRNGQGQNPAPDSDPRLDNGISNVAPRNDGRDDFADRSTQSGFDRDRPPRLSATNDELTPINPNQQLDENGNLMRPRNNRTDQDWQRRSNTSELSLPTRSSNGGERTSAPPLFDSETGRRQRNSPTYDDSYSNRGQPDTNRSGNGGTNSPSSEFNSGYNVPPQNPSDGNFENGQFDPRAGRNRVVPRYNEPDGAPRDNSPENWNRQNSGSGVSPDSNQRTQYQQVTGNQQAEMNGQPPFNDRTGRRPARAIADNSNQFYGGDTSYGSAYNNQFVNTSQQLVRRQVPADRYLPALPDYVDSPRMASRRVPDNQGVDRPEKPAGNGDVAPSSINGPNQNGSGEKADGTLADTDAANIKAYWFLWFLLLFSIGLNFYLGWISRSFYVRYIELADELRDTFTSSV